MTLRGDFQQGQCPDLTGDLCPLLLDVVFTTKPLIAPQGGMLELGVAINSQPVDQWSPSQPLCPFLAAVAGQCSMSERRHPCGDLGVAGCVLRKDGMKIERNEEKERLD